MFDDARPHRVYRSIWVARVVDEVDSCARCSESLRPEDVAFYTRTRRGDPFDPWCADCTYELVRWAGIGAVSAQAFATDKAREAMVELINRGRI